MYVLSINEQDRSKPIRILQNRIKLVESIFNSKGFHIINLHNTNSNLKNLLIDVISKLDFKNSDLVFYLNEFLTDYLKYTDDLIQSLKSTTEPILIDDIGNSHIIKIDDFREQLIERFLDGAAKYI